jgi:hypothetical protein
MKRAIALVATVVALAVPAAALADSCDNASRPAPPNYVPGSGPLIVGHWVWLPSIGVPENSWGFIAPGTFGTNGNYAGGQTVSLLGNSAICDGNGTAAANRQHGSGEEHGIQSGCADTPQP